MSEQDETPEPGDIRLGLRFTGELSVVKAEDINKDEQKEGDQS